MAAQINHRLMHFTLSTMIYRHPTGEKLLDYRDCKLSLNRKILDFSNFLCWSWWDDENAVDRVQTEKFPPTSQRCHLLLQPRDLLFPSALRILPPGSVAIRN